MMKNISNFVDTLRALHENDSNLQDAPTHYRPVRLKICCALSTYTKNYMRKIETKWNGYFIVNALAHFSPLHVFL